MVEQYGVDTLQPFLDQLCEVLTAGANGDPEPMKALCSHSDAISQCGFWGGVERGWAEVSERWEWVAAQFVPGPGVVTSDTAFLTVSGEMAYGVFIERWWGQFTSRSEPTELMIGATLIFGAKVACGRLSIGTAITPWSRHRQANAILRYSPICREKLFGKSECLCFGIPRVDKTGR